jgi:hypothetical protein
MPLNRGDYFMRKRKNNSVRTSKVEASKASKVLRNKKKSTEERSLAGSVLKNRAK